MIHISCYQPPRMLEYLVDSFGLTYEQPLVAVYDPTEGYSTKVMGFFQREPTGLVWASRKPFGDSSFLNPGEIDLGSGSSDRLVNLGISQPVRQKRPVFLKSKIL